MSEKEVSIQINNISKKYVIGREKQSNTLRDVVAGKASKLVRRGEREQAKTEDFWALRDVSFEVYRGETLGIVGGNGAGKSTLLKILSRIVEPTSGSFDVRGRVASLLEVGTGFHPELTGRENVFFNGSILGMTRRETQERFDEIVAFSEVERFIDTPVKFYSSGMYVRLAFAIAAHLDPEVLIIDEALAVGDVAFQQKCVEKMRASAQSGKTVLFVSHSMNIIEDLCDRVLYLKDGQVQTVGAPSKVISAYLGTTVEKLKTSWQLDDTYVHKQENPIVPLEMRLLDADDKGIGSYVVPGNDVSVDLKIDVTNPSKDLSIGVSIINEVGVRLFRTALTDPLDPKKHITPSKGINHFRVTLPTDDLLDGPYIIALDCDLYKKEWVHNPYFTPMRTRFFIKNDGTSPRTAWEADREGVLKPFYRWHKID